MDMVGKNDSHACSHCGKAAKMICVGCKGLPDALHGQMEVHYCGAECQKTHWASHKPLCNAARARKAIIRAADLAKAVSQLFLRIKYKMIIEEVKRFDNVWMICPPSEYKGGKCLLHPFPSALFPKKEDADVILEFQSCSAVLDHLHAFLKHLLTGICSGVDEILYSTKNTRLRLMQAYNNDPTSDTRNFDATDYPHSVIRLTLKTGDKFILDLTGAQYGWPEVLTPYNIYQQSKIRVIKEVLPFGGTRRFCKERAENSGVMAKLHHQADVDFETVLNNLLTQWQQANMSFTALLKLPDDQFGRQQAGLLGMLEAGMQKYKEFIIVTGALDLKGDIVVGGFDRKFQDINGKLMN